MNRKLCAWFLGFILLISCFSVMFLVPPVKAQEWGLDGWDYRKSHVIYNSTGAGSNYQMFFNLTYGSGSDSGEVVYLNSHAQTDFDDVRFTEDDGSTLLDAWAEYIDTSDYCECWVEISDDLSSSNVTIFLYYGNSGASSYWNGANTFDYFDDFTGASLDAMWTLWNENTAYCEMLFDGVNDRMNFWRKVGGGVWRGSQLYLDNAVSVGHAIRVNFQRTTGGTGANMIWQATMFTDSPTTRFSSDMLGEYTYTSAPGNEDYFSARWKRNGVSIANSTANGVSLDVYQIHEDRWDSDYVEYRIDGVVMGNTSDTTYIENSDQYVTFGGWTGADAGVRNGFWRWFLLRNYCHPEPQHGTWGAESENVFYITFYFTDGGEYRVEDEAVTNGSQAPYSPESVLEFLAAPINASYIFGSFNWTGGGSFSNPYNFTVSSNNTAWCYFTPRVRGEYVAIGLVVSLIFVPLLIIVIWAIIRRKK